MTYEKTTAIVLRTVEFSETSLIVTLFTEDAGKLSALAKGARRPKGPFDGALDLLTTCRVVFLRKSSGSLDLLTEAKLERRFHAATRSLPALYAGYYVAELLREMTDEHDPHPELFHLACRTLTALDENCEVPSCVLRFELGALRLLGHLPALAECCGCGSQTSKGQRVAFGLVAGGVLCHRCRHGKRQVASVSRPALRRMRQLADDEPDGELDDDGDKQRRKLDGEIRGLMNRYLCNLLGRRPKTQTLIS
ncbi:MAG: DNA repair protein RecO [Planctomycetales bacterium]|nr:DNA repair protein RecO [Planctomycetales bacterium]